MYFSVFTGGYLASLPQLGRHEISVVKLGLQKYAIDWREGVTVSVSLNCFAGGATTRWSVDRRVSLLHRESRSPTLMTIVPGYKGTINV